MRYTGPPRAGSNEGSCDPQSYGGGCSGTPAECRNCNQELTCCESGGCNGNLGYTCTPTNDCDSYKEDLNKLKGAKVHKYEKILSLTNFPVALRKGSDEYKILVSKLKGLICNKRPAKVGNMKHHLCQMLLQNKILS